MRGSYIWGMGQQRPPHGSKYKLKLGGEEELGKRSLEGCGYQETGCVVARWGEPCSEASGALRLGGGNRRPRPAETLTHLLPHGRPVLLRYFYLAGVPHSRWPDL